MTAADYEMIGRVVVTWVLPLAVVGWACFWIGWYARDDRIMLARLRRS